MATPAEHKPIESPAPIAVADGLPLSALVQPLIVAVLLGIAFWPILTSMYGSWFDDRSYMEHGILVIPAAAYMVWTKRETLAKIPQRPSRWGIPLLIWGALQGTLGVIASWPWMGRTAFLISLIGSIAAIYGMRMVRELAYPLCTLLLMITPPASLYGRLTLSLQLLASRLGETFLEALGYSVLREGNILELVGIKLSVEEACSGIRSLFSILFLCTLYNFFFVRGNFTKGLILVMAVPIAILGNAGRILATGIASQYNRNLTQGISHEMFGYIAIIVAAFGCIALHMLMVWLQKAWRT